MRLFNVSIICLASPRYADKVRDPECNWDGWWDMFEVAGVFSFTVDTL